MKFAEYVKQGCNSSNMIFGVEDLEALGVVVHRRIRPDVAMLRKVDSIIEHEIERWKQSSWVGGVQSIELLADETICGSTGCVAGHALIENGHTLAAVSLENGDEVLVLDGHVVSDAVVQQVAALELGILPIKGGIDLFDDGNSRENVRHHMEHIAAADGDVL